MQPNDRALYCILEAPGSSRKPGTQLALHVQLWAATKDEPETLCFYDTGRGHMIPGQVVGIEDHAIRFEDERGGIWELREVTIQEYRHRLAKTVPNGDEIAKTIKTTEDLWEWYRKTFPI